MEKKTWMQVAGVFLGGTLFVLTVIYIDVVARAKEAVREGDKYMEWHRHPDQKTAYLEGVFQKEKQQLDRELASGKITEDFYRSRLESLEFEKNFNTNESALKYAYQWYKDAYELFSPPHSKWVEEARKKAPEALAMWKVELKAKKIPFQDHMVE